MAVVEGHASWALRSDDLARHASNFLVNRWDAYGLNEGGKWRTVPGGPLDQALIRRHYSGEVVVGLHAAGGDGQCRWIGFDIDAKDASAAEEAPKVASRLCEVLDRFGIPHTDEDSDGRGGRHLWVIFETPIPTADARDFAALIAKEAGYRGEVFPKGEPSSATPYGGGFLRLPGRHPTRDHVSRIRSGGVWMVGVDAAEAWLGTPLLPASQLLRVLRGGLLLPDPTAVSVRDRTEEDRSEQKRTDEHRGEQKRAEEDRGEQRGAEGAQRSTDEGRGAQTRAEENRRLQKSSVRVPDLPQSEQDEIEAAITRCQPITVGVRQRAIFDLARRLRGIRSLQSVDPVGLRSIVEAWHRRALPVIGTKPFEDSWVDFLRAFPKVRSPLIDVVVEVASGLDELPDPSICERYESPQCRRLIKLVVAFAGKHADASGVFFMSCRSVAAAIGIGVTQAANYLFLLCEEALLERVDLQLGPRAAHRYRLGPILTTCAGDKQ